MYSILPLEISNALAESAEKTLRLTDPATNQNYFLVPSEIYEKLRALFNDDLAPQDFYSAADRTFSEGWNDPIMDEYDRYEEFKP